MFTGTISIMPVSCRSGPSGTAARAELPCRREGRAVHHPRNYNNNIDNNNNNNHQDKNNNINDINRNHDDNNNHNIYDKNDII